jgi:hypothetical protein
VPDAVAQLEAWCRDDTSMSALVGAVKPNESHARRWETGRLFLRCHLYGARGSIRVELIWKPDDRRAARIAITAPQTAIEPILDRVVRPLLDEAQRLALAEDGYGDTISVTRRPLDNLEQVEIASRDRR